MSRLTSHLLTAIGCFSLAMSSQDVADVRWIGSTPKHNSGATFGLPWPRGRYQANSTGFTASSGYEEQVELQSWVTAYWPDGSLKWTGHAIPASETVPDGYKVIVSDSGSGNYSKSSSTQSNRRQAQSQLVVSDQDDEVVVNTGKLTATFPKSGSVIVGTIQTSSGKTVGENGTLILRSQTGVVDGDSSSAPQSIETLDFDSDIEDVKVENSGPVRILVTVRGKHIIKQGTTSDHAAWLPFTLRFYLYANSEAIRVIHTLVFDGEADKDFISGIGIRFQVPLAGEELHNRHVRIAGVDGGFLNEAVQGITGLRRDPGEEVRQAQFAGAELPGLDTWDTRVSSRLQWIPAWNDYSLAQLSPDGFTLKKRTKAGQSWLKIPGGTRAGGLVYLGGATQGGLAVGLRDFWKRYPTALDITDAASDVGQITLWLYSPAAEPLDLRPYHDGLGEDTYAKQLDALEITYEDYEGGYNTPHGIARTNELFLFGFEKTPESDTLAALSEHIDAPPALATDPERIRQSNAIGTYWAPPATNATGTAQTIEEHLDFLFRFYENQQSQRRWYGFWDYGDIQHTYDDDRHTWRYDIGGYAWDNSELSPDLFFWNYFLRTGRADVYRFAEHHTRHTGEVDVYHAGDFKGFGTRHGVQHWGDSAKQIRISTPVYRKIFYYLSGGDERVGELIEEVLDAEKVFLVVDPRRKVRDDNGTAYVPDPHALQIDLGLDWAGFAIAWLIEYERRGARWQEARAKLFAGMRSIADLTNGFVTGQALYDMTDGAIAPPATDPHNAGHVEVSHLTASFGLPEIVAQIADHVGEADLPEGFLQAWLDYCVYYGATAAQQAARYGQSFGRLSLKQGHSRLTAYAAHKLQNATLAARAWAEFFDPGSDGLLPDDPWATVLLNGSRVLAPVEEATWITTNEAALYGLAGIVNLAFVGDAVT